MAKNKQSLVIDESRKLVNVIDCGVNCLEDENTRNKVNEKIKEPYEQVKIDEGNLTADQLV